MPKIDKLIYFRAEKALEICPFNAAFYETVQSIGVTANFVFLNKKTLFKNNVFNYKDEKSIESEFIWLIKVGILRREVDGQGLTSKVRITPLGREVFENNLSSLKEKKHYIHKLIICLMSTIRNK